jgi:hypothetical protein
MTGFPQAGVRLIIAIAVLLVLTESLPEKKLSDIRLL